MAQRSAVSSTSPASSVPWLPLTAVGLVGAVLAYLAKAPCRLGGAWMDGGQYTYSCYSDIFPLYFQYGLDHGARPYLDVPVEYPVLTGGVMHLAARVVAWLSPADRGLAYFDVTAAIMGVCLVAAVLATGYLAGRGGDRRAAVLAGGFVALAPAGVLAAYVNWDLLAVALLTLGLVAYARGRQWLAGVLIGLAVAAKFYPFLVFGPLFVLMVRELLRREGGVTPGDFLRPLAGTAVAWLAVNLPVYLAAPRAWEEFFRFSSERVADWGSVYYALSGFGLFDPGDRELTNLIGMAALAVACAAIAALVLFARRPPPLEHLVFLVVAAFLMTNKVWSPQFVLWLLPLAVLAWPRVVRAGPAVALLAVWQLAEVCYFFGIWQHLDHMSLLEEGASGGLGMDGYSVVLFGRLVSVLVLCVLVVVDCLRSGDSRT